MATRIELGHGLPLRQVLQWSWEFRAVRVNQDRREAACMIDVVNRLLNIEADLVFTITTPLDRRRPGNDEDRIRLRNLISDARRQVLDTWDAKRAEPLLARLDGAATVTKAASPNGRKRVCRSKGNGRRTCPRERVDFQDQATAGKESG